MANEFLRIDGFDIPVLAGSGRVEESEVGSIDRAEDGQLRDFIRVRPRVWRVNVPFTTWAKSDALQNLVRGRGHHIPFDTSYASDGGVGPNSGYAGCSLSTSAPSPKFGTRRLAITSAAAGMTFTVACPLGDQWTLMFWLYTAATAVWKHYAVTKDGTGTTVKYVNGVAGATLANYTVTVTGTSGSFNIQGKDNAGTNNLVHYDDLVILPWAATAQMVAAWAAQTVAFSPLPRLNLQGTFISDATVNRQVTVRGNVGGITTAEAHLGGTYYANLQAVELTFTEVAPYR
jgi:hypothetical protein